MASMIARGMGEQRLGRIFGGAILFAIAASCSDGAPEPNATASAGLEGDTLWVVGHNDLEHRAGEIAARMNAEGRLTELLTRILQQGVSTFPAASDQAEDEDPSGCLVGESLMSDLMRAAVYENPQRDVATGGWNVRARLDHERALSILRERPEPESALATWLLKDERWSKFARAAVASEISGIRP